MDKEISVNPSPSIRLTGQYTKELHFDNTNSPASFVPQKESPKIEVAINFNNRNLQENLYEVVLTLKVQAKSADMEDFNLFEVKLVYVGLVTLGDITDEGQKETILMVYVPTLLFPYARRILSDVTRDGGFQPLTLEPVDFAALHSQRKKQKQVTRSISVNS